MTPQQLGYEYAKGVFHYVADIGFWYVIAYVILYLIFNNFTPTDSTDKDKWHRSNVKVVTDHEKGCQYLQTRAGAITPRMNPDGTQMCQKN